MRRWIRSLAVVAGATALGLGFSIASGPLHFWPHDGGASLCTSTAQGERILVGDFFTAPAFSVTVTAVRLADARGITLERSWLVPEGTVGAAEYSTSDWQGKPEAAVTTVAPDEQVNVVGLLLRTSTGAGRARAMVVDYTIAGIPFTETLGIDVTLKDSCL
jgi:hypothetical protein